MTRQKRLVVLLLFTLAALTSCTIQKTPSINDGTAPEQQTAVPSANFDPDTLYELMVAELAGHRQRYDIALGNYLKQAHETQDVGVAKRAYQIATFIGAHQAILDAALLWSRLAPNAIDALQASTLALMQDGQHTAAVSRMQQLLAIDASIEFDVLAFNTAQLPQASQTALLDAFTTMINAYPNNHSLVLGKAMLLQQSNRDQDHQAALALCDTLLKQDAGYIKALLVKGQILYQQGKSTAAENMLAEAVNNHPDQPRLRLLYARLLVRTNQLDAAKQQFERLLQQAPDDSNIILSLGLIALSNASPDEATAHFKRLLALGQRTNIAHFQLGRLSEQQQYWQQAQAHYTAVKPGRTFIMAQAALTQMLIQQGQWQEARQQLATARYQYPTYAPSLYLLEGEHLSKHQSFDQALTLFNQALVHYPKHVDLHYARAMVFERLNRIDDLEQDLLSILAAQPDHVAALNALGYTLLNRTDRLAEAKVLIEKAYRINNNDPTIMDSMGWLQYRLGNYQQALQHLQAAYQQFPDPEVAAHLGEVLWMTGKKAEARALWQKALTDQPSSQIIKDTQQRLEKQQLTVTSEPASPPAR